MEKLVKKLNDDYSIYYTDHKFTISDLQLFKQMGFHAIINNFLLTDKNKFIYYIFDEKQKEVLGYCLCDTASQTVRFNEVYIGAIEILKNKSTGLGTILLNQITEHTKLLGRQRICLCPISINSSRFYWANGFVNNNNNYMYKEVDENIWLYSVVLDECMVRAQKYKTSVKKELDLMLENKDYDKLFEYNIIKEDYKKKGYNPKEEFLKFDKMLKDKVENDEVFSLALNEVQKCVDNKNNCYNKLKTYYDMNPESNTFLLTDEKRKQIKDVRNICADIYLIETDKKYNKNGYVNIFEEDEKTLKKQR